MVDGGKNNSAVTVVLPIIDVKSNSIALCLQSVVNQNLKNIEILIVSNFTRSELENQLNKYIKIDDRFTIVQEQTLNIVKAYNLSLNLAKGKYIFFLSPSWFLPDLDALKKLFRAAEQNNVMLCGGSFMNSEHVDLNYQFEDSCIMTYSDYQFDQGFNQFLYNRAFLIRNHIGFDESNNFSTSLFFVKTMLKAQTFYAVNEVITLDLNFHNVTLSNEKLKSKLSVYLNLLNLSSKCGLSFLHGLIIARIEDREVSQKCITALFDYNLDIANLLIQLHNTANMSLLRGSKFSMYGYYLYILRNISELVLNQNENNKIIDEYKARENLLEQEKDNLYNNILNIKKGYSFRIGRVITFLPRKIRNGFRWYKEHGISSIIRGLLWHMKIKS